MDDLEEVGAGAEVSIEYAQPPFVMAELVVLLDQRLHPTEKLVYLYLKGRCCGKGSTFVGQAVIMRDCGIKRTRLFEAISKLEELGLLKTSKKDMKNYYHLVHLSKVYGDDAYLSWNEIDRRARSESAPANNDVRPTEKPCSPERTSLFISNEGNQGSKEMVPAVAGDLLQPSVHPLAGAFPSSPKPEDPKEARRKLYQDVKNKQKEEKDARREARPKVAVNCTDYPPAPPGVLAADWEEKTCSTRFSGAYRAAMKAAGFETTARPTVAELAMWKTFLKKSGTIERGLKVIEAVISQWPELKKKHDTLNGSPGPNLFASKWMDVLMDEALKRDDIAATEVEREKKYGY